MNTESMESMSIESSEYSSYGTGSMETGSMESSEYSSYGTESMNTMSMESSEFSSYGTGSMESSEYSSYGTGSMETGSYGTRRHSTPNGSSASAWDAVDHGSIKKPFSPLLIVSAVSHQPAKVSVSTAKDKTDDKNISWTLLVIRSLFMRTTMTKL